MTLHIEKATESVSIEADAFTWMTVHGNLQLALRHPGNHGASTEVAKNFVKALEAVLVGVGILDQADIDQGHSVESEQSKLLRS